MKRALVLSVILLSSIILFAQVPQGINYQAVAYSGTGAPVMNATLQFKAAILSDTLTPVVVWEELHSTVKTNASGVFSVVIGTGVKQSGSASSFSSIDWNKTPLYLKIQIFYQNSWRYLGTSKLWSVPYALTSGNVTGLAGVQTEIDAIETGTGLNSNGSYTANTSAKYIASASSLKDADNKIDAQVKLNTENIAANSARIDDNTAAISANSAKMTITGTETSPDSALFRVVNKNGQTVFAVYNEGVRIYVDNGSKGAKGGFSVGGFGSDKAESQDLLYVDPDSVRVYIDANTGKANKGGFSIGGFNNAKALSEEYFRVTRDSVRVYLNDTISKAAKGGFSVGGFTKAKGTTHDYMTVAPDNTEFYVRTLADQSSSTFNIIGVDQNQAEKPLLMANKDTIEVTGVLNLQNNLIVNGDVSVTGIVSQDSLTIIKDADGNLYDTVKIGNQIWMKENLKTTKYNDGTPIPNIKDQAAWIGLTTGARCYYDNDSSYAKIYGALYNWHAISTGKLCPSGWHVSTDTEWHDMILRYDPSAVYVVNNWESATAGGIFKEEGTLHWSNPNLADNSSGLTLLPAGVRHVSSFMMKDTGTRLWASNASSTTQAFNRGFANDNTVISRNINDKTLGFSVRCVQNPPVPTDGLIAYYAFNGNVNDESGNNLNGTASGISYVDGKTDKAVKLISTSSVQVPDNSLLDFSSATGVTMAARIRQEQAVDGYILIKMGSGGSDDDEYSFAVTANGTLQGAFNSPATNKSIASNKNLSLNVWYSVVLMWEKATGNISVYIDGILDNKTTSSVTSVQNTTVPLIFGDPNIIVAAHSMAGSIDEIRIYNRVLSESDINSLKK